MRARLTGIYESAYAQLAGRPADLISGRIAQ